MTRFRPQLTLNFTVILVAKKGERGLKPEQDIFPKSGANRFRTGAGYFLNRVQKYNKFLKYANFGPLFCHKNVFWGRFLLAELAARAEQGKKGAGIQCRDNGRRGPAYNAGKERRGDFRIPFGRNRQNGNEIAG